MISAGDVTIDGKTITHDELIKQGEKSAKQLCGEFMGSQMNPAIPADETCVQTVMSTYNTAVASMTDRQIMVYNDAFRLMTMQRFFTCYNRFPNVELGKYKKGDVEQFNACTAAWVNDPAQMMSFGNEQKDLNYPAFTAYGEARAKGMIEIQSAEDLAIPADLQALIDRVKKDPKLSQPQKDQTVADLERMFRQAMGQVPRADRVSASVPVAKSVVKKAEPHVNNLLNESADPKVKDAAKRTLFYTLPGSVDPKNTTDPVVWRTAPDAVTGLLPPNASPELAAELRRLYGQALAIYAGKGGTDDAALANALKAAVEKVPADKRAEAISSWEVKDVPIDGSKKPTDVIMGPNTLAPSSLTDDNAGQHEFERRRAINALWARTVSLPGFKPEMRDKVAASLKPQLKDKHTYEIYKMTPTEVKPDGSVVISQIPLQILINGLISDEALRHAPNDMAATEMGGLNKIVSLYNKARLLRSQDSRPAVKNMTDEQLAQRVNAFARPILQKTAANPTPDTHIFTGDGTDITGFNDDGSLVTTVHDPSKLGRANATAVDGLVMATDGFLGIGYGNNSAWYGASFANLSLGYQLNPKLDIGGQLKVGGIWQNAMYPGDGGSFDVMQDNAGYGGLALRTASGYFGYTNKNGENVADRLVISAGMVNGRFSDRPEQMLSLSTGAFQGMIPGVGAANLGGRVDYKHSGEYRAAPFAAGPSPTWDLTLAGTLGQQARIGLAGKQWVAENHDLRVGVGAGANWDLGTTFGWNEFGMRLGGILAFTHSADPKQGGNLIMFSPSLTLQPWKHLEISGLGSYGRLTGPANPDGPMTVWKAGAELAFPTEAGGVGLRPLVQYLHTDASSKRRIAADQQDGTNDPDCEPGYDCSGTDGQQSSDPTANHALDPFAKMGTIWDVIGLGLEIAPNKYLTITPMFQVLLPSDQYGNNQQTSYQGVVNIGWNYNK